MSDWLESLGMDKPRHRRFSRYRRMPLPPVEHDDAFAPHAGPGRCVDSAGYVRDEHEYIVDHRDGSRCCWCFRLRRMEPLS